MNKIKNLPLMTKILYIITLLISIIWVLPTVNSYFSNMSQYEQSKQELTTISSKYGLSIDTQKFSKEVFKDQTEPLFSKVDIQELNNKAYKVNISMKQEELKKFHTMIETLALKYYVQIEKDLAFTTQENDIIEANFTLNTL